MQLELGIRAGATVSTSNVEEIPSAGHVSRYMMGAVPVWLRFSRVSLSIHSLFLPSCPHLRLHRPSSILFKSPFSKTDTMQIKNFAIVALSAGVLAAPEIEKRQDA